ncbi:hypothetical protein GOODEAATRI_030352, partial [Goodea atripinnis]
SRSPNVISAARSGFSRLLDHLLDQSAHSISFGSAEENTESSSLKLSQNRQTNLKVPSERFQTACEELRQALNREQEAQALIQEQSKQLQALQQRADKHSSEQCDTLSQTKQVRLLLTVHYKDLSLVIGSFWGFFFCCRHLKGLLRQECVIRCMKAAETSCKQVRESLVQLQHSVSTNRRPLLFTQEHLDLSGAKHLMLAPEVAACQLHHACSSRIDWLEQEVSAHRSHVTALRSELQDACLRESLAYISVGCRFHVSY